MRHLSKPILIPFLIFIISIASVPVLAQLMSDERMISDAARRALVGGARMAPNGGQVVTSDIRIDGSWAFGMIVTRAPEGIHSTPDLRLFMAQRQQDGSWQVALEFSDTFYDWLVQAPVTMVSLGQRNTLLSAAPANAFREALNPRADESYSLTLPYAVGETWTYVGGPHGNNGDGVRPWSAVDLAVDGTGRVRAADDGLIWRSSACRNFVRVDHDNGWQTGYYHLSDEKVSNGDTVTRGTWLGNTSNATGCGGWSSGPHVHFTLRRYGSHINIAGHNVGGWTILEGNYAYDGCIRRESDSMLMCAPRGQVYNDGSVGGVVVAEGRYDYDSDGVPDLWAINLRDTANDALSIHVADGNNPAQSIISGPVKMPQQPEFLNTAVAIADYDLDGVPDVWVIHRLDGSETTALRVMDGVSPGWLLLNAETALPPYDNSVSFSVSDYDGDGMHDLWAIVPRDAATNSVKVRIVSGDSPKTVLADSATVLPMQSVYGDTNFATADYNGDNIPDLWAINPRDTANSAVSLKIIDGSDFQNVLLDGPTTLPQQDTNLNSYGFSVSDYNSDGTPDLWLVKRKTSKVKIVSGNDFETILLNETAWLPSTNTLNWHIAGSDRARESVAPETPRLSGPAPASEVSATGIRFSWQPAGLAKKQIFLLKDKFGNKILKAKFNDSTEICQGAVCQINTDDYGLILQDDQTYTWFIKVKNAYGKVNSEKWTFTAEVPGAANLQSPALGEQVGTQPTFTWSGTLMTEVYKIVLKNPSIGYKFKEAMPATEACITNLCAFTLPQNVPPGDYNWKIVSKNKTFGGKSKSEKITFSVAVSTPVPTWTNTPEITVTAEPSLTPEPTVTDELSLTPEPTVTDEVVPTEESTATPTATSTPTATPTATLTE